MSINYTIPGGSVRTDLLELIENNHTLIAGTTGSGKSVLENSILYNILLSHFPGSVSNGYGCKLILIDPKRVELINFVSVPHCIKYTDTAAGAVEVLKYTRAIIENRIEQMQRERRRTFDGCPIYIFIDEIVDLMTAKESKEITRILTDCISISRAARVFFVICTQAPNRKILKPEIVLNCSCRIALKCISPIESRQIIDSPEAVDLPSHGQGIVIKGIDRYKIRIPLYSDYDIDDIITFWRRQHPILNYCNQKNKIV